MKEQLLFISMKSFNKKVESMNLISDAIASRATAMQNSLNAIIAVCSNVTIRGFR